MLPERLVLCRAEGGSLEPLYLQVSDHPWLRVLLDQFEQFAGRPVVELEEELGRYGLPVEAPPGKLRLATHLLLRQGAGERRFAVRPSQVRAAVFAEAAGEGGREGAVERASQLLGLEPEEVEDLLLADQRSERRVVLPEPLPGAADLGLQANLALAQSLVGRALRVRIELEGNARAVVRQAKLGGLVCTIAGVPSGREDLLLEVSGPLALFRRTRLYGRALGGLVPLLPWSRRYRLQALCRVRSREGAFELRTGDPIPPAPAPQAYDSAVEERFARAFRRLGSNWHLIREPEPLSSPLGLVFPDFALVHRHAPGRRWLVEIAGFWTPAYVREKLARLRAVVSSRFVLCLEASLNCADEDLPAGASVLRFRRSVDAARVLEVIERG